MSGSDSEGAEDQDDSSVNSDESMQASDEGTEQSDEENSEEEVLEPKVLPARGTRGNRMTALVAEEDSADEEFWQQEFFAEENKDIEYEKSSEGEDEADTDFSESEDDDDNDEAEEVDRREARRSSRLKPLKPPGSKPAAAPKPKQPVSAEAKAAQAALKAERVAQQATPGAAPTLRHSTRVRVEEAEQVRQRAEKVKPRRPAAKVEYRPLTQEEILAEAARTELDNLRDLEQMVAMEEATKQKALYKRSKYSGPMIRYHSSKVEGAALSMMEVINMLPPPHMLPSIAPTPAAKMTCIITGKPARYRDPASGHGYADLAAYKELKERWNHERRGKTGKRTKRQRSSGILQTTQPSASLSPQVAPAVTGAAAACGQSDIQPAAAQVMTMPTGSAGGAAAASHTSQSGTSSAVAAMTGAQLHPTRLVQPARTESPATAAASMQSDSSQLASAAQAVDLPMVQKLQSPAALMAAVPLGAADQRPQAPELQTAVSLATQMQADAQGNASQSQSAEVQF